MTYLFKFNALILSFLLSMNSYSNCLRNPSNLLGYTIVHVGNVTGYINKDGKEENDFEGCEYGRTLIIDYSKSVTCQEYQYQYAYNPDIVIFANKFNWKACIDGSMYSISQ